jgi:putative endopeptidase
MRLFRWPAVFTAAVAATLAHAAEPPRVPRFSVDHLDRPVRPQDDFYRFATGAWVTNNPVPADKSRWAAFDELEQRTWFLVRGLLEDAAAHPGGDPARRQVGEFFAAAMNTNRLEELGFQPLRADLDRIAAMDTPEAAGRLLGDFHRRGIGAAFSLYMFPDRKDSRVYSVNLYQGGLGLPDRDYYLAEGFAKQREEYGRHVARMFELLGDAPADAAEAARLVVSLETELAKASRARQDLRDDTKNYHKQTRDELQAVTPNLEWEEYFTAAGLGGIKDVIVGQPEFFEALDRLAGERELPDWRAYLRWHLVRGTAPLLHAAAEDEHFRFFGTALRGQPAQEPRWQRAARLADEALGEAVGRLFVEKHFPPAAKARMDELVNNLKDVFRDRLAKLDWMGEATRAEARRKFDRFTQKIGHPARFRDYSTVVIKADDFLGNVQRAAAFEWDRNARRIGGPVDRDEWGMTPQTVNAYFNPTLNEIVFPAGILQPPFFDPELDDAVNYGAIGMVIGHEITHGYDDQGRKYDAEGNLRDWWTEADAREFDARAQRLVRQYGAYEPLPGAKVNGQLTLGENIADLGGVSLAYEALQRALAKDPAKRRPVDGFTPEQRFFLSAAQIWRVNWREAELRRRLVTDPHAPAQFRAVGPHVNLAQFFAAWDIKPGDTMWRAPEDRAQIW